MRSPRPIVCLFFCVPAILGAAACQVEMDRFYARTYACDSTVRNENTCGTTRTGAPMTCFPARQLGTRDFCVERCEGGPVALPAERAMCLESRAKLAVCKPSDDVGGRACAEGHQCLRTDIFGDEGLCLATPVCDTDAQCPESPRLTCAATLLKRMYGASPYLKADHMYCLQENCKRDGSNCASGEACLPNVISPSSSPPDICVPKCDADLNCPPNHFCYRKVSGPAAPAVCIPGIIGFRCRSNVDCLMGECVDTGDGFSLCSPACRTQDDCRPWSGARGPFSCTDDVDGEGRHCMNPLAFGGSPCNTATDCREGEQCVRYQPYDDNTEGNCRPRCGDDGRCRARAGIPHTCLEGGGTRACYPGRVSVPCIDDAECGGPMKCLASSIPDKDGSPRTINTCTVACTSEADCTRDAWTAETFCAAGTCVHRYRKGWACTRENECWSRQCLPSTMPGEFERGVKRCG